MFTVYIDEYIYIYDSVSLIKKKKNKEERKECLIRDCGKAVVFSFVDGLH